MESVELIRQSEAGECGLACIAMIASHYGLKADVSSLRRRFPLSARGATVKVLIEIADSLGLHIRALRSELQSITKIQTPCIIHWGLNHFVVLERVNLTPGAEKYVVVDPAKGRRLISQSEFSREFTGIVLEIEPNEAFTPGNMRPRLKLTQMWSRARGVAAAIGKILVASLIVQLAALIMPLYMQTALDTAVPSQDNDLLLAMAIGFGGVLFINSLASWVRANLILSLSNTLAMQSAVNLFRHTIYLPVSWFEKRHLGDIVSRFGSLQPITDSLSKGLVSSVVDGILSIITIIFMVIISPLISIVSIVSVAIYIGLKIAFFNAMKLSQANIMNAQALETSAFIENIRGIEAIKSFCQERNRQRLWQNKKADYINASVKLGKVSTSFDALNALVTGLETVVFVYVAVGMAMKGDITIGAIFAFQAYKSQFMGAVLRSVDQLMSFRLMDMHLDRVSDIAFSNPEPATDDGPGEGEGPAPRVELRNVSFTYGLGSSYILRNVSLTLESGAITALVGPSGSGKTTLLKIMCGLLQPTSGAVYVDGQPLSDYGVRKYRRQIGVVNQSDSLFSGSIAENITFFEPDYDQKDLRRCCALASIHDDIHKMPLRYETLVGDMGSNLSGGQKQRVLLARALYNQPRILFMDEGTAHLDVETERKVSEAIRTLGITRVLVAHRPDTIAMADYQVHVQGGQVFLMKRKLASSEDLELN